MNNKITEQNLRIYQEDRLRQSGRTTRLADAYIQILFTTGRLGRFQVQDNIEDSPQPSSYVWELILGRLEREHSLKNMPVSWGPNWICYNNLIWFNNRDGEIDLNFGNLSPEDFLISKQPKEFADGTSSISSGPYDSNTSTKPDVGIGDFEEWWDSEAPEELANMPAHRIRAIGRMIDTGFSSRKLVWQIHKGWANNDEKPRKLKRKP